MQERLKEGIIQIVIVTDRGNSSFALIPQNPPPVDKKKCLNLEFIQNTYFCASSTKRVYKYAGLILH